MSLVFAISIFGQFTLLIWFPLLKLHPGGVLSYRMHPNSYGKVASIIFRR